MGHLPSRVAADGLAGLLSPCYNKPTVVLALGQTDVNFYSGCPTGDYLARSNVAVAFGLSTSNASNFDVESNGWRVPAHEVISFSVDTGEAPGAVGLAAGGTLWIVPR